MSDAADSPEPENVPTLYADPHRLRTFCADVLLGAVCAAVLVWACGVLASWWWGL